MTPRSPRFLFAALVAFAVLAGVAPVHAFTRLEGEYVFQLDVRKQDRRYEWDFDSNSNDTFNNPQLRLFSQPIPGLEAFTKFEAEWNTGSNSNRRPLFQYREAHVRYNRDVNGKKIAPTPARIVSGDNQITSARTSTVVTRSAHQSPRIHAGIMAPPIST
jgi:hypothetical protein